MISEAQDLRSAFRPTTLIRSPRLSRHVGLGVLIASETFQYTGSFKFRAAYSVARIVPNPHIITASSGNFGQALAYACRLVDKRCHVVMPQTSAQIKIDAVREFGGEVVFVDTTTSSRTEKLNELAQQFPEAYVASPFDDDLVIQGNSSLAHELVESGEAFDSIIVPIGGGGLASGLVKGFRSKGANVQIYGAEPAMANDASLSFHKGKLIANKMEPQTIADGARTLSLGNRNWDILRTGLKDIIEIPEERIKEAVKVLFELANLKVEPTGALAVAALFENPGRFNAQSSVCCIVSGGNVDPALYKTLL